MKRILSTIFIIILVFFLGAITATMVKDTAASEDALIHRVESPGTSDNSGHTSFRELAARVTPAVVHINTEFTVKAESYFPFDDPFFKRFFRDMPEMERKNQSMGSGFIFNEDGYIVTNNHVVRNADKITVKLQDGREFSGEEIEIIGLDERTDLAVIKIRGAEDLPYIPFGDSQTLFVGDWVMAVGNPFGFDGTVTVGVVSAKNRSKLNMRGAPVYQDFIQTDASINPGNSGGPLVDINGTVVGINSAIASPSGGNVGIGFAIPSNMAIEVVEQLLQTGTVTRGYLGVYPQELTPELKEKFGLAQDRQGVLIAQVEEGAPADKGGLKDGDVIIEFDGKPIENVSRFRIAVANTKVGRTVNVKIIRDKKEKTLSIAIGELESEPVAQKETEESREWLGIEVTGIDDETRERYNIQVSRGVIITDIKRDSPVLEEGIKPGDVIVKIENESVDDINDFNTLRKKYADKEKILLTLKRGRVNMWKVIENK
ncbi:MAG: DegQ family serine endoprotease [candidate division WOR-3 bacterium]|nr:DegQ family serine endoprotease [candidate division WOR-3 bacterium]